MTASIAGRDAVTITGLARVDWLRVGYQARRELITMPMPQWFEELTVLADLPPRQLLKQLRDLDETAAVRALELRLADPDHGYTFDGGEIAELAESSWYQGGQAAKSPS